MADLETRFATLEKTEKAQRALDRLKERFKVSSLPPALEVLAGSEAGINDMYMNMNRQFGDGALPEKSKLIVAVGVAAAAGSPGAVAFFTEAAIAAGATEEQCLEAVSTAAVCGVFNGYYRFRHQVPEDLAETYAAFKAPFNANTFMKGKLDGKEMESVCIAVSSLNGCHMCVEGHVKKGKQLGLTDEQIDELVKVTAVAEALSRLAAALRGTAQATSASA